MATSHGVDVAGIGQFMGVLRRSSGRIEPDVFDRQLDRRGVAVAAER